MDISLDIIAIVLAILVPVISWVLLFGKAARERATTDKGVADELKAIRDSLTGLKEVMSELKKIIGNGGYGGLRADIHNLQIEMTALKEQIKGMQCDVTELKGDVTEMKNK